MMTDAELELWSGTEVDHGKTLMPIVWMTNLLKCVQHTIRSSARFRLRHRGSTSIRPPRPAIQRVPRRNTGRDARAGVQGDYRPAVDHQQDVQLRMGATACGIHAGGWQGWAKVRPEAARTDRSRTVPAAARCRPAICPSLVGGSVKESIGFN